MNELLWWYLLKNVQIETKRKNHNITTNTCCEQYIKKKKYVHAFFLCLIHAIKKCLITVNTPTTSGVYGCPAAPWHDRGWLIWAKKKKVIGHPLPSLKDLSSTHCLTRAGSILQDCTHPGHRVFKLLLSGRLNDSFYNTATALINANSWPDWIPPWTF